MRRPIRFAVIGVLAGLTLACGAFGTTSDPPAVPADAASSELDAAADGGGNGGGGGDSRPDGATVLDAGSCTALLDEDFSAGLGAFGNAKTKPPMGSKIEASNGYLVATAVPPDAEAEVSKPFPDGLASGTFIVEFVMRVTQHPYNWETSIAGCAVELDSGAEFRIKLTQSNNLEWERRETNGERAQVQIGQGPSVPTTFTYRMELTRSQNTTVTAQLFVNGVAPGAPLSVKTTSTSPTVKCGIDTAQGSGTEPLIRAIDWVKVRRCF